MQTCTEQLGKYVADTAYEKLPEEVIAQAKLRVLDVIGIGLSGSKTDVSRISKFCREHGGEGASTIWGTDIKTSPEYAALANIPPSGQDCWQCLAPPRCQRCAWPCPPRFCPVPC